MCAIALLDLCVLVVAVPSPQTLTGDVTAPHAWLARVGPDGAAFELAAAALWCVAVWIAVALLALAARAVPGAAGRIADRLARVILPRALYRAAAGAAGLGVLLAPVAAGAAPPGATAHVSAPAPVWPSDGPLPAPMWPSGPAAAVSAGSPRPAHLPAPPAHASPPRASAPPQPTSVLVEPGDTLWSIAADHLPSATRTGRIAHEWPRWYGANRAVIGDDPALIHPGQVLHAPADQVGR